MNKPVFLWWAHKGIWDAISKNPRVPTIETISAFLTRPSGLILGFPVAGCFACDSRDSLQAQRYNETISCEFCPLDWRVAKDMPNDCVRSDVGLEALFDEAVSAHDYELAAKYAAQIRDLPLSPNAHELYTIKEHEDE